MSFQIFASLRETLTNSPIHRFTSSTLFLTFAPMQKLLIFIDWFLPGYKAGGPIRSIANLVDHFHGDYQLYIITSDTDYCDTTPYPTVKSDTWNDFEGKALVYYISRENLNYNNLKDLIGQTEFDLAYVNGIYSWYYSILPLHICKKMKKPVVVAARGMLSGQAFSSKSFKKKLFINAAKAFGLFKKVKFQATSEQEIKDIKKYLGPRTKIYHLSNLPRVSKDNQKRLIKKESGKLRMLNVARISPEKNNHFAIEVLTRIKGPGDIILDLYGPIYNQEYWQKCQNLIKKLPENVTVNYKGSISPEDLEGTLPGYHFLLFPSTGENFGHAIYEAFSFAVPVIISDQTPWRNLSQKNAGWDLPLHQPQRWQDILRKCYEMEQEEYDRLCNGAHALARQYIEKSNFKEQYRELFEI